MIKATLGEVHITKADYRLCDILGISKSEVDMVVETGLGADLSSILGALTDVYGAEKALEMWTKSAEIFIEYMKGDTSK